MKKILSIAIALVMVMALSLTAFADSEVVYEYQSPFAVAIGWTTLFEKGSNDANAFFEAVRTEGAVIQLIGTDLTEADRTDEEVWFQLCTQDAANWTDGGNSKTEGIGETYEFTDEGYVMTVSAAAYNELLSACTVPASDMNLVLNSGGSWTKAATNIVLRVVTGVEAPAAEEPAAEEPAAEEPAAEEPAASEPAADESAPAAPAESTSAPETGLVLAVIPAIVAMAAAVVSNKH